MHFYVDNMTCGGCARSVTKAIVDVDPNAKIVTDPPNRSVQVSSTAPLDDIKKSLQNAGFPVRE